MGNREMHRRGVRSSAGTEWREPLHVMDDIRAAGELLPGDTRASREAKAMDLYDYLCDFCHPNMGAFSQYYLLEEHGDLTRLLLRPSPRDTVPTNEARIATSLGLYAAWELLGIYNRYPNLMSRLETIRETFMADRPAP